MDTPELNEIIEWFCRKLNESGITVEKIILFGSYSTNSHSVYSDIDLAVISQDFEGVHILDRIPMVGNAEWETTKKYLIPLDLILLTPDEYDRENSIRMSFIRKGTSMPIHA